MSADSPTREEAARLELLAGRIPHEDLDAAERLGVEQLLRDSPLAKFYEEHPASQIKPCIFADAACWAHESETRRVFKELTMDVRLDLCKTWSARLTRKALVGVLNGGNVYAIFTSKVGGALNRTTAERAAEEGARIAGWIE